LSFSLQIEGGSVAGMVIGRFGGMVQVSEKTALTYEEVRNIKRRGNLTEEERAIVLLGASQNGVHLSSVDFIKHLVHLG
jgi:hypothetical protein